MSVFFLVSYARLPTPFPWGQWALAQNILAFLIRIDWKGDWIHWLHMVPGGWCGGTSKKYILMIRLQRIVIPNVVHQYLHLFRSSSFQGKLLKHNLDSEVVDALKDLRRKLSENESKTQSSRSGWIYISRLLLTSLL